MMISINPSCDWITITERVMGRAKGSQATTFDIYPYPYPLTHLMTLELRVQLKKCVALELSCTCHLSIYPGGDFHLSATTPLFPQPVGKIPVVH